MSGLSTRYDTRIDTGPTNYYPAFYFKVFVIIKKTRKNFTLNFDF